MEPPSPVSAIVTAFRRPDTTIATIRHLQRCRPLPAEILVHVDDNQQELASRLRQEFPDIQVLESESRLGPGGARNLLLKAANENLVASFDDDSHPADADYFQRVMDAFTAWPDAAVITATLLDGTHPVPSTEEAATRVATFAGGGCVYRRTVFFTTTGYVPLPVAYGMEEMDLALRLHAMGRTIVHDPNLRVVHEIEMENRESDVASAAAVSNLALLAFLRYPVIFWPLGVLQCLRKALELVLHGRWKGAVAGLWSIPSHVWQHRRHRSALACSAILSHIRLRRRHGSQVTAD